MDAAARRAPGPGRRAEGAAADRRAKGAATTKRAGAPASQHRYGAAASASGAREPKQRAAPSRDAAEQKAQKAFDRRRASARREAAEEADGLLYGRHPIAELLRSGGTPHKLWLLAQHLRPDATWAGLVAQAQARGTQIESADAEQLEALVGDAVHQGAVALVPPFAYASLDTLLPPKGGGEAPGGTTPLLLVLDQVQDPHNLGALTRSAAAFGATGVVIAKDRGARMTPTAIKASAGAAYHVPVAQVVNLARALETMRARGVWTVGLDVGGEQTLGKVDLCGPVALVVGAEGEGLRPLVARGCDFLVKLPLARIGSLNASVAGAIALYEVACARTGQDAKAETSA